MNDAPPAMQLDVEVTTQPLAPREHSRLNGKRAGQTWPGQDLTRQPRPMATGNRPYLHGSHFSSDVEVRV